MAASGSAPGDAHDDGGIGRAVVDQQPAGAGDAQQRLLQLQLPQDREPREPQQLEGRWRWHLRGLRYDDCHCRLQLFRLQNGVSALSAAAWMSAPQGGQARLMLHWLVIRLPRIVLHASCLSSCERCLHAALIRHIAQQFCSTQAHGPDGNQHPQHCPLAAGQSR